jgi:hypothetical protein
MTNPLAQYREDKKLTWLELATLCELSSSQAGYTMKMGPEQIKNLLLGTVLRIKEKTGVDLVKYAEGK